jgi:hypothetical protein
MIAAKAENRHGRELTVKHLYVRSVLVAAVVLAAGD